MSKLEQISNKGQHIYYSYQRDQSVQGASESFATQTHPATVTLINGHSRTHSDFKMMSKKLVMSGYDVLSFDNRGSGMSVADEGFSLDDMASDVVALWQHLGINRSHLLGISMGGMIAQVLASSSSDVVDHLILVSTASSPKWLTSEVVDFSADDDDLLQKMKTYFHPSFVARNFAIVEAMVKQMRKGFIDKKTANQADLQRKAIEAFDPDKLSLEGFKSPALIIHGADDSIISSESARELAAKIPGATLKVYEECGHLILAEKSADFYRDVIEFLP